MSKATKISDLNQSVAIQRMVETETEDGNTMKTFVTRFTALANIKATNTSQAWANGMDEKDTLYTMLIIYSPDRVIEINDRIIWGGKTLKPVGDMTISDYGNKRLIKQIIKHSAG